MRKTWRPIAATVAALIAPSLAQAQELRVGYINTLSGAGAGPGVEQTNAWKLGLEHEGWKQDGDKIGGVPTKIFYADDQWKPDVGVKEIEKFIRQDKVHVVAGFMWSNVLMAAQKPIVESKTGLLITNAGASPMAGELCSPYVVSTSFNNEQFTEGLGKFITDEKVESIYLMAPNYQAGKDSIAGFKRHFKGEVLDEVYTPLGQLDFSAEIAKIAAAKPQAFFTFMPGGMGVNLVKQYRQAGLNNIPFLSAFTTDESTLPAQKDDAVGFLAGSNWAPNTDTPENKAFVAAYEAAYGSVPGTYAMQAYDAALLIDSALKATGGKTSDPAALRTALEKADFKSLRGKFKFGSNHYPVQDFFLVKVAKRADGKYQTEIAEKVFSDYVDVYAKDCQMK